MRPYVRRAATAVMLWVLLVTLAKGYESVDLQNDPEMERGLSVQPPESPTYQLLKYQCIQRGNFPVPGSCKDFYQCEELPGYGIMPTLFTCPAGTIFDKNLGVCNLPSQVINRADCSDLNRESARIEDSSNNFPTTGRILENTRTLSRQKGAATLAVLGNVLTAVSLGVGLYNAIKPANGIDISRIESKLSGIEAQLDGRNLQLYINQIKSNVISKIILKEVLKNNRPNFKDTPDLIHEGISQRNLNAAIIQGLIVQGNAANEKQFSEVHQSIGKLKGFVSQEMIKSEIQKGYTSVSTSIDKVKIKPLVSNVLNSIKEFHSKINHLLSLPEKNKKNEMEKSGGYIDYLQSTTLQHTLWEIIHQKWAIPTNVSDTSAVFILDLLVDGLQIQTSILSAIVSSNIYLAIKAHEERNLEDFNTYMQKVNSSIERMRLYLGFDSEHSLSNKVNAVIDSVRPYAYQITGLDELLSEKQLVLEQLESKMSQFIEENTQMEEPGMIQRIPNFRDSSVSIPFGPWESGKQVSYAIQLVSKSKISPVGEWSRPHTVSDKANPTIYFPRAKEGVQRLLYRRFNEEKPELVAIVSNKEQTSLKDFGRDLINAASRPNQDLAVTEVRVLLEEDVDVDITLENNMTPLHYAAKYNNVEVMKLMLNRYADIHARSSDNETPLHFASLLGNNDALEYLISEGAQVNEQTTLLGWSPLHIATAKDHVNIARILIRNNALINIKDNKGLTPLHLSIQGNGGTMEILLAENTTNVNARDNEGQTPLHRAARSSTFYSVEQLLKHPEIEVDALSYSHMSPLHCAAMSGNVDIIEELLISNASLFLEDEGGSTPLHYAAFYGNTDAALKLVLRNESLISVKNKDGETALDQAVANKHYELIWILKEETETQETSGSGQSHSAEKAETDYTLKGVSCTDQTVQEMAMQSQEICAQMGHITNYIDIIVSQIPIRYREEEALADIVDTYNNDLQNAKSNANLWKNGDSILGGIQLTFRLVKAFEGSFNRKYKITEDSILALSSTSNGEEGVEATEIMGEISKLKSDINRTESALTSLTSSDTDMKVYLESLLRESKADLETKERVISTGPTILPKLEELLYFLELVSEDANKINEKAATIKQRINDYSVKVNKDKALFDDIGQRARMKLTDLERRSLRNNGELASIRDTRAQLEDEVKNYRRIVSGLYNEIYNTQSELRRKRMKLLKQYESGNSRRLIAAFMAPIFIIISIPLMQEASYRDQLLIETWQDNLRRNKAEADRITHLIEEKEHLIVQHRETIANGSRNSQPLVRELNIINKLEYDLKNIIVELPSVQPSLEQAEDGLQKIEDVFTHIAQALDEMMDIGKAAKTEEEIENALNSIHESLSTLQCNWKGSDWYVTDMRSCSKQL